LVSLFGDLLKLGFGFGLCLICELAARDLPGASLLESDSRIARKLSRLAGHERSGSLLAKS
jgi:hypothetical protein